MPLVKCKAPTSSTPVSNYPPPLILRAPIFSIVTFVNVIVPNSAETKHGLSV